MSENTGTANPKKSSLRWVVLAFCVLFFFLLLGLTNQTFNFIIGTIGDDLGWSGENRAAIQGALSTGMVFFVLLAGILMDRWSTKKIIGAAVFICGVLVILRAVVQDVTTFYAIMFLYGMASAFYHPAATKMITLWFDKDELYLANGWLLSAAPAGMLVANLGTPTIVAALGGNWQTLFVIIGTVAIIVVILFFILAKERKSEDAALESDILTKDDLSIWKNIKGIVKVPLFWVFCLANIMFLGTLHGAMQWGQYIFQFDWGLPPTLAGSISAFANVTGILAYIIFPFVMKKIGFQHFAKIAVVACLLGGVLNFIGHVSYVYFVIAITMTITGMLNGIAVPAPRILMLQLPEVSGMRAGTAMGIFETVNRVYIAFFATLLGMMISFHEGGGAITRPSVSLGLMYLMQIGAGLLLLLSIFMVKKKLAKAQEAAKAAKEAALAKRAAAKAAKEAEEAEGKDESQ